MEFKELSTDSGKFTSIVETFIRNGAPFEVNISSDMKKAVLNQADAASFAALSLVSSSTSSVVLDASKLPKG